MTFELTHLVIVSISYLLLLFLTAFATERGYLPAKIANHPVTYVLSLGVYASAWAFYGTVGLAHQYGFLFLAYYLGICGAFLLAPVLLIPILRITQTYQLASLADLFTFRFRSSWAGTLTTFFMLLAVLPLLALQIQAVTDTVQILTQHAMPEKLALGFCIMIIMFAILFGARHIAGGKKHAGLVVAIAFESLIKLIAILIIGGYALFVVFSGPADMQSWLSDHATALAALQTPLDEGPWRTLLLVFFASAIVMPHMFHMCFTENQSRHALSVASWGLPLLLLLLSISIPPILWAGLKLNNPTHPEYFTIGIGLASQTPWLSLLGYIGGLSAASALIVVTTLALSAMVLNHIVLPVIQPQGSQNLYQWLLNIRRILIALIILAGYGFYRLLGAEQDLSNLGIVAFVGALQFLPGVLSVLYWPQGNHKGFICGLIIGFTVWSLTLLTPLLSELPQVSLVSTLLGYWGVDSNAEPWHIAAIGSLLINTLVFIAVSLITQMSDAELSAANACAVDNIHRPARKELAACTPQDFQAALSKPLGLHMAQHEVDRALVDLGYTYAEKRPYALRRLRDRLEANLSGLMGPAVATDIVDTFLPFKHNNEGYVSEDIQFIESRLERYRSQLTGLAAELDGLRRYHRQTLESLPLAICTLGKDHEVLMWNKAMSQLTDISATQIIGSYLDDVAEPWQALLKRTIQHSNDHLHKQQLVINNEPRWINAHKAAIPPITSFSNQNTIATNAQKTINQDASRQQASVGGFVILLEDQTEAQLMADKLLHSQRLASIGQLAAGVAHEIGNPVTAIACLAQELKSESSDPLTTEMAEQIVTQTKRISNIVQSLVNFAHSGSTPKLIPNVEHVNLFTTIDEAIKLVSLKQHDKIVHFSNTCDQSIMVQGIAQRLLQVFINLLNNARDASPNQGYIKITSRIQQPNKGLPERQQKYAIISVIDQGEGISEANQRQIFEPFFTTKDPGEGTGLGLAMVFNIVREHSGRITIKSPMQQAPPFGTQVSVWLPIEEP
ncbi:ATP-binding protein [Zooshikella ganghwensis]|uniref:ATP-binding protein n=1 Tax=Zooshikella ganghwensis TaxID=202772 RepID=UPI001F208AAC|nr:ATP-binding protein [Zooshikella ganghwensis]